MKFFATALTCAALMTSGFAISQASAESFDDAQKQEINTLVQNYIEENPKVILDALENYRLEQIRQVEEEAGAKAAALIEDVRENPNKFPTIGAKNGEVIVVEFFDYNCGYCKKAFETIQEALDKNKDVTFALIEMPILGPTSKIASQYSLAAEKQGKYLEFHTAVMNHKGQKDAAAMKEIGKKVGLDIARLEKDAKSDAVQEAIDANMKIAEELGITGTPGIIIESEIIRGYIPYEQMNSVIQAEKKKKG